MTDTKDPVRQLFEAAVYAPIGLAMLARKELPALTAAGKNRVESQITLARFIGRLAISRGTQEIKRRLDAAEAARRSGAPVVDATSVETLIETLVEAPVHVPTPADVVSLPDTIIAAVVEAEADAVGHEPAGDGAPAALPIEGYDSLAASQVVVRLSTLTPDELALIQEHESTHRNRRTILGKIQQLQAR